MSKPVHLRVPLRNRIRARLGGIIRRPMIRDKDRFLAVAHDSCQQLQEDVLRRLVALNQESQFSKDFGLTQKTTVSEFRRQLPIADYELFRPYVQQMQAGQHSALLGPENKLLMYALTSGTTGAAKLIPVTNRFLADYRKGWQRWGIATQQDHPTMKQLRMVQMISDHQQWYADDGIPCGNISGLATTMQRPIVRKLYVIPALTARITHSPSKQYATMRFAVEEPWVGTFITANPSTLIRFCEQMNELAEPLIKDIHDGRLTLESVDEGVLRKLSRGLRKNPERAKQLEQIMCNDGWLNPVACWPQLACLGVWTGGSAGAYAGLLKSKFCDIPIRDHGLHASEGRMTIPFSDNSASGILDVDSHFFEFIPVQDADSSEPTTLLAHELQVDSDYFILLTTSSGLYRYNIRDVVRCTGFHGTTPELKFLHKGSSISSVSGEKISESQVVDAVNQTDTDISIQQFTMTPEWGQPPGYKLYLCTESATASASDLAKLAKGVDRTLQEINCEYADKRQSGRLDMLVCQQLPREKWDDFKQSRLKKSGGSEEQYKHPCLLPDPEFQRLFAKAFDC